MIKKLMGGIKEYFFIPAADFKIEPKIPLKGFFRVCETNPVYECGWIFVSNELNIEDAIVHKERYEKLFPHLTYTIVPV